MGYYTNENAVLNYSILGLGLLSTLPLWAEAFNKEKSYQALISVSATLVSYGYWLFSGDVSGWWQPVSITATLALGGWILTRQTRFVYGAERKLAGLIPDKAAVVDGIEIEHVEVNELQVGQVVLVRPGNRIPCDGNVIQGQSLVDQNAITGESAVLKQPGDWVLAGSDNLAGRGSSHAPLTIRVSAIGEETLVNILDSSVNLEDDEPVRFGKLASNLSSILSATLVVIAILVAGFEVLIENDFEKAARFAVGILLSAQIAALSYTIPYIAIATAIKAASLGFVVRSRKAFESFAKANHVVINKTGVLTNGYKRVGKIHLARNTSIGSEDELLALAASVEMGTSHELGHLIIQEAVKRNLELPVVEDIAALPGMGISARFDGSLVRVGNSGMVNVTGVNMNPYDLFMVSSAYSEGASVVFVSLDELLVGYIEFPDELRENSPQAVIDLSGKVAITVLSGDATAVVEKFTQKLGLSDYAAEVLSTRKADWIKERKASGSKVLYIGDGQYDAAALAEADSAIAFGVGHEIHQASAEIVQISQDPRSTVKLIVLSRKAQSKSLWNLLVATVASFALAALALLSVYPSAIAFLGVFTTWLLLRRVVRLVR